MEASMLIGGEWLSAASREELEVVNPATEEIAGTVPSASPTSTYQHCKATLSRLSKAIRSA